MKLNYFSIHPGETLLDWMNEHSKTCDEVATISGIDKPTILEIINCNKYITPIIAKKLSKATEVSPDFWLNLQKEYYKDISKR